MLTTVLYLPLCTAQIIRKAANSSCGASALAPCRSQPKKYLDENGLFTPGMDEGKEKPPRPSGSSLALYWPGVPGWLVISRGSLVP